MKNPFTPTFGIVPPYLAGRESLLDEMASAFESGPGNPNLSTILVGARGCGKTALLLSMSDEASQRGWVTVKVAAAPGMLGDITQRALESAAEFIEPKERRHLTGIHIAQLFGLEWTVDPDDQSNWRTKMNAIFDELSKRNLGMLICVDEVDARVDELVQLVSTYQLFVGEGKKVALLMAGLPKNTIDLMDNDHISFLRRARQRRLGRISDSDIERAFRKTVEMAGKSISDEALSLAVSAAGGYAYMMQLVGYESWENSEGRMEISEDDVKRGVAQALDEFRNGVLESTLREMSKGDRTFARAMLASSGPSTLTEIATRMGKGTNYTSTYKKRLLSQGAIEERGGATFDFAIPHLREYLKDELGVPEQ